VVEALKELQEEEYKKYFLLIDEIDSFQLDAKFRTSMERCMEFYKIFSKEGRALLSATQIEFSDPELKNEIQTFLKYASFVTKTN
jgi:hypothetical protein